MKMSQFTDYSLRVLMYVGTKGEKSTVSEMAKTFNISKHHLVKVVHKLATNGYLKTTKGKNGGVYLNMAPQDINVGTLVRELENLTLAECFQQESNTCPLMGCCDFEKLLFRARKKFMDELSLVNLDQLLNKETKPQKIKRLNLRHQQPML